MEDPKYNEKDINNQYTEKELKVVKKRNILTIDNNMEYYLPLGSDRRKLTGNLSNRKGSDSEPYSPRKSHSLKGNYKISGYMSPSKSNLNSMVNEEIKNVHHLRNTDKQRQWSNKALNNKHVFPHLQSLDPEINEIQSVSQDSWNTLASFLGVHIFFYRSADKTIYLKTENHIPDNFYSLASVIFDEYSIRNWNPYLLQMNVEQYIKDEYGIYDAQYELKIEDEKYKICDKWLSLLWQNSSSNFLLKYNLNNEKSKYQKSSNYRYNVPFEQIQIERVTNNINNPGVFKECGSIADFNNLSETCIMKHYLKLPNFKNASPSLTKQEKADTPEFFELFLRKFIYKKMCYLAGVMKNESGQIYDEIFGTYINLKGKQMSEAITIINELEAKRIEENNDESVQYYDFDIIRKYDTIENDADWNDPETHILGRREIMKENYPEREPKLDQFMTKMKSKFGSRVSHIPENVFARYVDGWLGDLTIAEENFQKYIDWQKKRRLFKKYHWDIKPCCDVKNLVNYLGKAKDGCSIVLISFRNMEPGIAEFETWADYFIQLNNYFAMKSQKHDKTYIIIDTYNIGYGNTDLNKFKLIAPIVGNLVPDMMKKAFLVRCNWMQDLLYKTAKAFVHPRTIQKVSLVSGNSEKHSKVLEEYFDLSIFPKCLGGIIEDFE